MHTVYIYHTVLLYMINIWSDDSRLKDTNFYINFHILS